ncbi:cupin domain-containing protein [Actinosynnema sp. NPDC020468]|uniref:cupin domain-containing protein n=1 Tax=Actinosynnema sp. NPDC020468 TaxID=3154488 RepID=UPI0033C6D01F
MIPESALFALVGWGIVPGVEIRDGVVLVREGQAERVGAPEAVISLLADSGAASVNRSRFVGREGGAPPHFHRLASEMFFVVGGVLEVLVGEEVVSLRGGDFLSVPPGVPHAFGAAEGEEADVLCVFTPGVGRFEYYRLLERVRVGEAGVGEIARSGERFDNYYVDSPVWTGRGR